MYIGLLFVYRGWAVVVSHNGANAGTSAGLAQQLIDMLQSMPEMLRDLDRPRKCVANEHSNVPLSDVWAVV